MTTTNLSYSVPGVSCAHCQAAIAEEVGFVPGVEAVHVDLDKKRVEIRGQGLDDAAVRSAIAEAGYEVA